MLPDQLSYRGLVKSAILGALLGLFDDLREMITRRAPELKLMESGSGQVVLRGRQ